MSRRVQHDRRSSQPNVTLAVNGTLTFAAGDTVTLNNYYNTATQIVVGSGGLLTATATAFVNAGSLATTPTSTSTPAAPPGQRQHLRRRASSTWPSAAVFNAGDLAGDGFDPPLYIPAIDVQYLSAPEHNLRFQDIDIQPAPSPAARPSP